MKKRVFAFFLALCLSFGLLSTDCGLFTVAHAVTSGLCVCGALRTKICWGTPVQIMLLGIPIIAGVSATNIIQTPASMKRKNICMEAIFPLLKS